MQDRLNQNDVTNRVNVEDPQRVRDAVLALFAARYPGENLNRLARAFDDFRALFEGRFPATSPATRYITTSGIRSTSRSPWRA